MANICSHRRWNSVLVSFCQYAVTNEENIRYTKTICHRLLSGSDGGLLER